MAHLAATASRAAAAPRDEPRARWGRGRRADAARAAAGALALAFGAVGTVERDVEALAFGGLTLVAAALTLLRRGLPGRVGLALVALDTLVWMGPAAAANAGGDEPLSAVAVPLLLAALAAAVLLLVAGAPPLPAVAGVVVAAGATLAWAVVSGGGGAGGPVDARVEMENVRFSPPSVTIRRGGVLAVRNDDLFWHTFTVDGLDLDLGVPTGATRRVVVDAPPGTYRVVCAIPGHEKAGMTGTLTVAG